MKVDPRVESSLVLSFKMRIASRLPSNSGCSGHPVDMSSWTSVDFRRIEMRDVEKMSNMIRNSSSRSEAFIYIYQTASQVVMTGPELSCPSRARLHETGETYGTTT